MRDYSDGEVWGIGDELMCKTEAIADAMCDLLFQLYAAQGEEVVFHTRTHEAEMEKMLRAEIAHNIAEYVMEHDAVVYERQEEENNDLQLSATFRFLQPHEGEWKI